MKKLLIVVDYQNDFVNGSLGFPKAKELENKIYDKIMRYKNNDDYIVFTQDTHFKDYLKTREGEHLPVEHCMKGTEGHELYGKLKDIDNSFIYNYINKTSFGLDSIDIGYQIPIDIDFIEIVGVATNICVISTAITLQNYFTNTEITIDASCCASFDDYLHEKALDIMEGLQMNIINRNKGDK